MRNDGKKQKYPNQFQFPDQAADIAMDQIRAAVAADVPRGMKARPTRLMANSNEFRDGLDRTRIAICIGRTKLYDSLGAGQTTSAGPSREEKWGGRPPRLLQRSPEHQPVTVKQLAACLPAHRF